MRFTDYIESLKTRLEAPSLPGFNSQLKMAPDGRFDTDYHPVPPGSRLAAVLILMHEHESEVRIPLIVRADNGAPHSGQIALPGGNRQADEPYPAETAMREAAEEIGLDREKVQILGNLTPLYIPASNYSVTPVLASCSSPLSLHKDEREVAEIRWIMLDELLNSPKTGLFMSRSAGKQIRAPYFSTSAGRVWGATAMMLVEFVEIIRAFD